MSQENEQGKKWIERMKNTYRLVVMNNETFEEIGSYKLSLLNVYILISTVIVVVALMVVSLISFTPLRKYIPGYGDVSAQEKLVEISGELEQMEKQLESQHLYYDNVKKVLTGKVETEQAVEEQNTEVQDSIVEAERSQADEKLRKEMALAEIGAVAQQNRTTNLGRENVSLAQLFFSPPVTGEISAGFMPDKKHLGVDILAPKNTAVKATLDGYVFLSDWTLETGNTIGIQHPNNIITFYKHNSILLKKAGSHVKAGEAVAIIGNTGTLTDGPHLHFELWHRGKPVDPTDYINF